MSLNNYRDVSQKGSNMNAGFQFEFYCANCARTWESPFEPYRRGQLAGYIYRFAYLLGDRGSMFRATNTVSDMGSKGALHGALQRAIVLAEQRYFKCTSCAKTVCEECWDSRARQCELCAHGSQGSHDHRSRQKGDDDGRAAGGRGGSREPAESAATLKCPNCSTAIGGGRFCEECGFDMASTHKSCPGCGTLCARSTRFCADCGHAF